MTLAKNSLGHPYENGLGVEPDRDRVLRFYAEAAQEGSADAAANLIRLQQAR